MQLDNARRPPKQRQQQGGQPVDAHLFHVVAPDDAAAAGLLERLHAVEGLVVIPVDDEVLAWVPERMRNMVLTPAAAKGLEYPSVCAISNRAGCRPARRPPPGPMANPNSRALREHEHRTTIDQSASGADRATETMPSSTWPDDALTKPKLRPSCLRTLRPTTRTT